MRGSGEGVDEKDQDHHLFRGSACGSDWVASREPSPSVGEEVKRIPVVASRRESNERIRTLHAMGYHTKRVRLPNGDVAVLRSRSKPKSEPLISSPLGMLAVGMGIYLIAKAYGSAAGQSGATSTLAEMK
jgi:hypothetical protein